MNEKNLITVLPAQWFTMKEMAAVRKNMQTSLSNGSQSGLTPFAILDAVYCDFSDTDCEQCHIAWLKHVAQ